MPTWLQGFLGGVGASLLASVLFLGVLASLRPRIAISEYIAKRRNPEDGKIEYLIKFVNRSRRSCVDLQLNAYIATETQLPANAKGTETAANRTMKALELAKRGPFVHGRRKDNADAPHAQRVRIKTEHIDEWQRSRQTKYIMVRIVAKDGVSGFPAVFERKYVLANCIKEGTFITGDSLRVTTWKDPAVDPSDLDTPDTGGQPAAQAG